MGSAKEPLADFVRAVVDPMRTSDWVLIGSTFFLGAVALFVPTVAEAVKRWFYSPRLRIDFSLGGPDCHKTLQRLVTAPSLAEPCYYFRFKVTNLGKAQARRCEATIESVAKQDAGGRFSPLENYSTVGVGWGSGQGDFVDINPTRSFHCDFFHISSLTHQTMLKGGGQYVDTPGPSFDLGLEINAKTFFYSSPNRLGPGRYKIGVAVFGENCDPIRRVFEINWTGNWADDPVQLFKECVVV